MTELQIENEVKARMDFKLQQIMDTLTNSAENLSARSFLHPQDPGYYDESQRFRDLIPMVQEVWEKEVNMSIPNHEMFIGNYREKRDELHTAIWEEVLKSVEGRITLAQEKVLHNVILKHVETAMKWNLPKINVV